MKKLIATILIGSSTIAFSQNISDYEYIYVPASFEKKMDKFNLRNVLIQQLTAKKYKVIQEDNKSCAVLKANLLDDSSFLKNKVKIDFTDCNGKLITEAKGSSDDKDFETGYPEALKNAFLKISMSNPKTTTTLEEIKGKNEVAVLKEITEPTKTTSLPNQSVSNALSYTNGEQTYQLVKLGQNQFILVSSQSSVPFAKLTESSKAGIFHVALQDNTPTMGYSENGNIIIDIPKSDGTFSKEIFIKK
ncbi:hypothetical protein [Soonwooa sp.]|uniref:hypothetical protein n=1 Tax=Soonwooa sp. TaxID=1938592 RepID=UPI0026269776|nr:hypothetical protein [Soonwooa sp.]